MRLFRNFTGVLLIVLGLSALGWFIWNMGLTYLGLVSYSNSENAAQSARNKTADTVFTLPNIRFWTFQVGVFSQEANARAEEQRLKALGFPASLFSSDPWSVGIGYASKPEDLKGLKEELSGLGITAYLKEVTINEQRYKIDGNGAVPTIKILEGINSMLRLEYGDKTWDEKLALMNKTFKEEIPRELYTMRDEFEALITADPKTISLKRLSLSMRYRETLSLLTNKYPNVSTSIFTP